MHGRPTTWRFGLIKGRGLSRYRAVHEQDSDASTADPHGRMQDYAESLTFGVVEPGDRIVAHRLEDGAIFVKEVLNVKPPTQPTVTLR